MVNLSEQSHLEFVWTSLNVLSALVNEHGPADRKFCVLIGVVEFAILGLAIHSSPNLYQQA